jgi:hypothetical protein
MASARLSSGFPGPGRVAITGMSLRLMILLLAAWLYGFSAQAAESPGSLVVVVPRDAAVEALSKRQVMELFLRKSHASNIPLVPYDRDETDLKADFYRYFADMSLNRLRAYWAKKVFTSRGKPPESLSAEQLGSAFRGGSAAISYMRKDQLDDAMKIVHEVSDEP